MIIESLESTEIVPSSPLFQPAHCQEVAPGDAPKLTGMGMAGTLKWDVWEGWSRGMES